jgi:hypothetical protein
MQVHIMVVATFARTDKHLESAFFERPQLTGQLIVGAVKARLIQIVSVLIHLQSKVKSTITLCRPSLSQRAQWPKKKKQFK